MTTLENSYCRPETVDEWVECLPWMLNDPMLDGIAGRSFVAYGDGTVAREPREGMTELTVGRFLDLLNDRIVPWRLEEVGFQNRYGTRYVLLQSHAWMDSDGGGEFIDRAIRFNSEDSSVYLSGNPINITTFTDLLTLIRFLTPNTNKP